MFQDSPIICQNNTIQYQCRFVSVFVQKKNYQALSIVFRDFFFNSAFIFLMFQDSNKSIRLSIKLIVSCSNLGIKKLTFCRRNLRPGRRSKASATSKLASRQAKKVHCCAIDSFVSGTFDGQLRPSKLKFTRR